MVPRLKRIRFSTWLKLGLGAVVITLVLVFLPLKELRQAVSFDRLLLWVKSTPSNGWTMLIFFTTFSLVILFFPVTVFPIIGGVLFPFWIAFPLNMAAELSGALLAFGVARFFGREVVETFLRGRMKTFDRFAAHEGIKTILVVRLSGFPPFIVANYLLGLSSVKIYEFILGTLIGITPWTILMTGLSGVFWQAALHGGQKGLMKAVMETMGPISGISIAVITTVMWIAYRKKKKAQGIGERKLPHSNL